MGGRAAAAAVAQGERSVAIGGDVIGSVIVTGDNATVELKVGSAAGALLALVRGRQKPKQRPRPTPLDVRPPPFANRVDRLQETADLLAGDGAPISLCGEAGLGKTYVLATALQESQGRSRDGIVYVFAKGKPLEDLLQELFEQFYDCRPPAKASVAQIARALADKEAVIVLDSLELERDEAQQLLVALPRSRIVVASRERQLWDGRVVALRGLATADAVTLVEQELGTVLEGRDRDAAERLCVALAGHPLKIRQAVALARDGGTKLEELAARLGGEAPRSLTELVLEPLSLDGKRVLATLAAVGGHSIGEERLADASGVSDVGAVAAELEQRHLVESHSPRYSLAGGLDAELGDAVDLEKALELALQSFTAWARSAHDEPAALLREALPLLQLIVQASASGHDRAAIALARAVESAFALGRRWGAWELILDRVLTAARRIGDRSDEAWALHQLGTRAFCLGDPNYATAALREALRIRRGLGDDAGAAASAHNLGLIAGSPPTLVGRLARLPFVTLAVVAGALVLASGGSAAYVWWNHHHHHHHGGGGGGGASMFALTLAKTGKGAGIVQSRPHGIDCGATCTAAFAAGSAVTLTAVPAAGSSFAGWSGGGCSGTSTCRVHVGGAVPVTARFDAVATATLAVTVGGPGSGTVTSTPAGVDCPRRCHAAFARGSRVTLVAQPDGGSTFRDWGGSVCGVRPTCTVEVRGRTVATASFARAVTRVQATVRLSGDGRGIVTSKPAGIDCGSRCAASFERGSTVLLTATAAAGSAFAGWSGACAGTGPCRLTLSSDEVATASFTRARPTQTLTVVTRGDGSGRVVSTPSGIDCGATCTASFPAGTSVELEAQPLDGSVFAGWTGAGCTGTDRCVVAMSQSQTVTAVFDPVPPPVTLSVGTEGTGSGTVTSDDGGISACSRACTASYPPGSVVTLRATASSGSLFIGWKSADCTGSGPCTVTLGASKREFAVFRIRPPA